MVSFSDCAIASRLCLCLCLCVYLACIRDTLGELSLTDGPERYAKLAFPELEREAARQRSSATNDGAACHGADNKPASTQGNPASDHVPGERRGERAACGVVFKMDSFGRPLVDAVLEGGSARAHNEACVREGNGMSRHIVVGDRLLSIDDKPCVGFCSVSPQPLFALHACLVYWILTMVPRASCNPCSLGHPHHLTIPTGE